MQQTNKKNITKKIILLLSITSFFLSVLPSFSQNTEIKSGDEYIIPENPALNVPKIEDSENNEGEVDSKIDDSTDEAVEGPLEKSTDEIPEKLIEEPAEKQIDEPVEKEKKSEAPARKLLKGHISKIPTGTKFKIIIETPISEESSVINDEIQAKVLKDIYVKNEFAVPAGSLVTGVITDIVPSKKFHKAGRAKIEFKDIKTPDGLHIPISAITLHKGVVKGKYTKRTSLISAGSVLGPIAAGAGAGLLIDSSPIGAGIGAAAGAVLGIGLFLFEKGNKLNVKSGDKLDIELIEDAIIPEDDGKSENESAKSVDEEKNPEKQPKIEIKNFDDADDVKEEK